MYRQAILKVLTNVIIEFLTTKLQKEEESEEDARLSQDEDAEGNVHMEEAKKEATKAKDQVEIYRQTKLEFLTLI
jgi:hypothetical protein